MSDTSPAPALLVLRDELEKHWPQRDRGADGILGDAAHQARVSDHNQGNAIDITYDPANGPDLEALADTLMKDPRTHYVIWNRRIRNPSIEAGAWRAYTGESPHTEHLHLSIDPTKRDEGSAWVVAAELPAQGPERQATTDVDNTAVVVGLLLLVGVATAALGFAQLEPSVGLHHAAAPHRRPVPRHWRSA